MVFYITNVQTYVLGILNSLIPFQDLVFFDLRFGSVMNNCVYIYTKIHNRRDLVRNRRDFLPWPYGHVVGAIARGMFFSISPSLVMVAFFLQSLAFFLSLFLSFVLGLFWLEEVTSLDWRTPHDNFCK